MQRRTKLLLALGAAGLVGFGVAADLALADRRGHHAWHSAHHGWSSERLRSFFERYDLNKDGSVTQEEIDQNRAQWLQEFDANGDGQLSLVEFQALWLRARFEHMVREFQRFDRNGDGQVTLEEYRRPLSDIVERLDRTGDGAVTRDDVQRRRGVDARRSNQPQRGSGSGEEQPQQQ